MSEPRRIQQFVFNIGDKVLVKEICRPGVIERLMVCSDGLQYCVAYWNDSNRKAEWLYEWELELHD